MTDDPKRADDRRADGTPPGGRSGRVAAGADAAKLQIERGSAIPADEMARLSDEIVGALKTVYDPEIPADIYELGLI